MSKIVKTIKATQKTRLPATSDGLFIAGVNAEEIYLSNDKKIEFVILNGKTGANGEREERCLAGVISGVANTAYYPLNDVTVGKKITSVVMDLDGTTASSEKFWVEIIRLVVVEMTGNAKFKFKAEDIPFISGHSVSEHLGYCIQKFCPGFDLNKAMLIYRNITERELNNLVSDCGTAEFEPTAGIKDFILSAKARGVKVGLVTSGSYDKAYPEIVAIMRKLGMGSAAELYDTVITAGNPLEKNLFGTMGEVSAKPHPWLYVEASAIGLGNKKNSGTVIGFEDSGAGVMALRLAGIPVIGIKNGNIVASGYQSFCEFMVEDMSEAYRILKDRLGK